MVILTVQQAYSYAYQAGFRTNPSNAGSIDVIVAIAQAESGLNTAKTHINLDGSIDRGILQFNNVQPPVPVSDNCAYDPGCAFNAAARVYYNPGLGFSPWISYRNKSYLKFMPGTKQPVTNQPVNQQPVGSSFPAYAGTPWYDYGVTRGHGGGEHGIDLGTPLNTPMTAVFPGVITDISGFANPNNPLASGYSTTGYGGQVTWRLDNPSVALGVPYEYVIHLNALNPQLRVGMHIDSGTLLGWTGGETAGQPATPAPTGQYTIDSSTYSGGQHTEVGLYGGPQFGAGQAWISGPNIDPAFMIAIAQHEKLPFGTGGGSISGNPFDTGFSGSLTTTQFTGFIPNTQSDKQNAYGYDQLAIDVHNSLVQYPGFYGICLALDEAEHFPGVYNAFNSSNPLDTPREIWNSIAGTFVGNAMPFVIRGSLIAFGFIMLVALMWQLIKQPLEMAPELLALA